MSFYDSCMNLADEYNEVLAAVGYSSSYAMFHHSKEVSHEVSKS